MGFAPDRWDGLCAAMEKKGYTQEELLDAGLVLRSEKSGNLYDRFRNRLMFPIIDVRGHVIGFGGRVMDGATPKYLNSPETLIFNKRKNLFAMNLAKKSKAGQIILVEGYMDAVALHQFGFDCAVASLGTALTEDHASLLARYTDRVVLIYDGDQAGQSATQRAIPMLEKTGLRVRILRMQGAKDPDEFLHKFGPDRFRLLLEGAENQMEYRLQSLQRQYDLSQDGQKVEFLKAAAELLASVGNAVEREVYGARAAEAAGVSPEAVRLETEKAFRRRTRRDAKRQEKIDLAPAVKLRPRSKTIRYDNMKSAMAEEMLLSLVLRESALLDSTGGLEAEMFSSELLGRVYAQLKQRHEQGLDVSLAALTDLTPEEMSHIAGILHRQQGPVNEQALTDCIRTIQNEYQASKVATEDDLLAVRERMKERKGMKA